MTGIYKFSNFCNSICDSSNSDNYHIAIHEWKSNGSKTGDDYCICGKSISKCFFILNKLNGNHLTVGRV